MIIRGNQYLLPATPPITRGDDSDSIVKGLGEDDPKKCILDGIASHITIDGIARFVYRSFEPESRQILIARTSGGPTAQLLVNATDGTATTYPRLTMRSHSNAGLRSVVQNASSTIVQDAQSSSALAWDDGRWHVLEWVNRLTSTTFHSRMKVDGIPVEVDRAPNGTFITGNLGAWDGDLFTIGAVRFGTGPTIAAFAQLDVAYYALVTGEQLVDARHNDLWLSFDQGGGRRDLRFVTERLARQSSTAVIRYAGPLDGRAEAHIALSGEATYVSCTFAPARF